MKELSALDTDATFQGFIGERMQKEGLDLTKLLPRDGIYGFAGGFLIDLSAIRKEFKQAKKELLQYKPDVLVLVDYPALICEWRHLQKLQHYGSILYYTSGLGMERI